MGKEACKEGIGSDITIGVASCLGPKACEGNGADIGGGSWYVQSLFDYLTVYFPDNNSR